MALYYEGLSLPGILNRNIPNSLEYREKLLTDEEWFVLAKRQKQHQTENKLQMFIEEAR